MELLKVKVGESEFSSNQVTLAHRPEKEAMLVIYLADVSLDAVKDVFTTVTADTKIQVYGKNGLEAEYTGFKFTNLSFLSLSTRDAGNTYQSEVSVTLDKVMEV